MEEELIKSTNNEIKKRQFIRISKSLTAHSTEGNNNNDIDELAFMPNVNSEPNNCKVAISCPQTNEWQEAMQAEIDKLNKQNTWTITSLPEDKIPLKGR